MMSSSLDRFFPPPSKRRKKLPMLGWLVCVTPPQDGIRHWLVVAPSLEEAFQEIRELPLNPTATLQLGYLIEPSNWCDFMKKPLAQVCSCCNPQQLFSMDQLVREFAEYATAGNRYRTEW